jgi:hypothetical protein
MTSLVDFLAGRFFLRFAADFALPRAVPVFFGARGFLVRGLDVDGVAFRAFNVPVMPAWAIATASFTSLRRVFTPMLHHARRTPFVPAVHHEAMKGPGERP